MKKRIIALGLLWCLFAVMLQAARVDTVLVRSAAMNKDVKVVYVLPDKAIGKQACPVVYLLHGYGGNAKTWIGVKPDLPQIADEKGIIFVCPDGKNSWYYATIPDRKARAISGLSMGGHGALWSAIRHKDVFGAAGSMSGGVDIRPFPQNWEMNKQLGEFAANKASWDAHTVVNQLDKIVNGDLALIIDCGEADFFLEVNKDLHNRLLARKIDHDFITRPGGHTGTYWNNSIDYHVLFFDKFFKK